MARFFDLLNHSNQSIQSKATGTFISLSTPPSNLKVADDWDVTPGDVLSWSDYRATETYFVTSERTLLKNPDTSAAGYLTIPLSITSLFSDAVKHFSPILDQIGRDYVSSIELGPNDAFFSSHFSKQPLPASIRNRNDLSYSFDPNEELLYVTHASNPDVRQYFPLHTATTEEIVEWIATINEPKGTLIVNWSAEGEEKSKEIPRGTIQGLPIGWQCEQQGTLSSGPHGHKGQWKCQGPDKSKVEARQAIERFYKGFSIDIE